jgi:uncharacterized membrane protein
MRAIQTFLKGILFLAMCIVGWTIVPVLFIVGGLVLFLYALVVEGFLSLVKPAPAPDDSREMADRMSATQPSRSVVP